MAPEGSYPSLSPDTWKRVFPWIVATCGVFVLGLYVFAGWALVAHASRAFDLGWTMAYQRGGWYVVSVDDLGEAAGRIQRGDRVVDVLSGSRSVGPLLTSDLDPGVPYTVRVERSGAALDVVLSTPTSIRLTYFAGSAALILVSAACFAVALLLGFSRPDLFLARLGSMTFFAASLEFLIPALDPVRGGLRTPFAHFANAAMVAPGPLAFALTYHFYMRFPAVARSGRLWEYLRVGLYWLSAAFLLPNLIVYSSLAKSDFFGASFSLSEPAALFRYLAIYRIWAVASLGAGMLVLGRNYVRARSRDDRRRLRWVLGSVAASLIPYSALQIADVVSVRAGGPSIVANSWAYPLVACVSTLFVLVPAAFAFTILKHHVFDVEVAVRLGVRYLLARGALEAVLALPIVVHVVRILAHPNMTIGEMLYGSPLTLVLVVTAVISLKMRKRVRRAIDKRFFRDEYDRERVLTGLIDDITQQDSISEISRRVSAELDAALHPRRLAILYREDGATELTVAYSNGDRMPGFTLSCESSLLRLLEGDSHAHEIAASGGTLPDDERGALRDAGFVLVVPMAASDRRLCGLLLLGEKRSEEPYSGRDRTLLESVAAQMAIVYENTQLKSRVAHDRKIRVEVLGRMDRDLVNLVKECPSCGACYDSADERCSSDGTELTLSLPVERTIDGKYRLERLVGKGGMGAVYEGTDLRLTRRVAVKILTGHMFGDLAALKRFEREAQASARLSHTNIVRVYDYGAVGDAGAFLVMELLRGRTLRAATRALGGRLNTTHAARIFDEVFEGVAAAHAAGVVHRDLKPENIFLAVGEGDVRETVKLLDFGLAKIRNAPEDGAPSLTAPGTVMGTFGYMSPEQLSGGVVDERTDVFALGVIVYEALVGRRPYDAKTWVDLIAATTIGNVRLPGDSPDVRRLGTALKRCLASEPSRRYPSVTAARTEIIPLIRACTRVGPALSSADAEPTKVYGDGS